MKDRIDLGDDPILSECRNRMPEPIRYSGEYYRVIINEEHNFKWWTGELKVIIPYDCLDTRKVETFRKIVVARKGVVFSAWQSERDKKIYI